jgi:cell division transport system permease protein
MRAQFVFHEVWIGLRRNLTMTIALVVVVAISLSVLGTGLLFVKQVDNTRTYWQGRVQLSIYLCTRSSVSPQCEHNGAATAAERAQIEADLKNLPQVVSVRYESQEEAYSRFRQEFSQNQSFVNSVSKGDIPDSFQVKLKNTQTDFPIVAQTVDGRDGVDQVVDDSSILDKFYKLLNGARNAVVIIAIILIIAAILLVANTIRLSAFNRRRETSIMRLVGASNFYVQLPFLVRGTSQPVRLAGRGLLDWGQVALLDTLAVLPFNVQLSATDLVRSSFSR